jgi:hypothetical protein
MNRQTTQVQPRDGSRKPEEYESTPEIRRLTRQFGRLRTRIRQSEHMTPTMPAKPEGSSSRSRTASGLGNGSRGSRRKSSRRSRGTSIRS